MARTHTVDATPAYNEAPEIRCTCGALLVTGLSCVVDKKMIEEAYDKHMINVLEITWVQQFYQTGEQYETK